MIVKKKLLHGNLLWTCDRCKDERREKDQGLGRALLFAWATHHQKCEPK